MLRMPGAVLMSRLKVYATPTPDGQRGGTPHVHLLCTEMYVVLGGSGAVELIDSRGFSRVDLQQHDALVFTPGTLHRLINPQGDLEILVIMQNEGLPERGDNVVCFGEQWLATDAAYTEAMRVTSLEEAYRRRDRGVEGFLQLRAAFDTSLEAGQQALQRFYQLAEERTQPHRAAWEDVIRRGAVAAEQESLQQLQALQDHDMTYLMLTRHHVITTGAQTALGFCGHLHRYFDSETLTPEGIRHT